MRHDKASVQLDCERCSAVFLTSVAMAAHTASFHRLPQKATPSPQAAEPQAAVESGRSSGGLPLSLPATAPYGSGKCIKQWCQEAFASWADFVEHYNRQHAEACEKCLTEIQPKHVSPHSSISRHDLKCSRCEASFIKLRHLRRHETNYHGGPAPVLPAFSQ